MDPRNPDSLRCVGCGAEPFQLHATDCTAVRHRRSVPMDGWPTKDTQPKASIKPPSKAKPKVTSDGSSSAYYFLPKGATELNDLIEHKEMSFARGNIFKALYRLGEKEGIDVEYDLNKIELFLERLRDMNRKGRRL